MSVEELRDMTPTSLMNGYGENVCALLLGMANLVLGFQQWHIPVMTYTDTSNSDMLANPNDELDDEGDEVRGTKVFINSDIIGCPFI